MQLLVQLLICEAKSCLGKAIVYQRTEDQIAEYLFALGLLKAIQEVRPVDLHSVYDRHRLAPTTTNDGCHKCCSGNENKKDPSDSYWFTQLIAAPY